MSCWHGCGPRHGWPVPHGWCGPYVDEADWYDDVEWPMRRPRRRRERVLERESTAGLEARVEELRDELERVQAVLVEMRKGAAEPAER